MKLYHTGYDIVKRPDIHRGRANADFGRGFYLSPDQCFAESWAQEKRDTLPVVNRYRLSCGGLRVLRLYRDIEWYRCIRDHRVGRTDGKKDIDIVIGPIANDTIFDTLGIMTSGFLSEEEGLRLLRIGPAYTQVVIKSARAAERLCWLSARQLSAAEVSASAVSLRRREAEYQQMLAAVMQDML